MKKVRLFFFILLCCSVFSFVLAAEQQLPPTPDNNVPANTTQDSTTQDSATTPDSATPDSVTPESTALEKTTTEEGAEGVSAERPVRKRGTRLRSRLPSGIFGADNSATPNAADTMLGGTIPAIWEIQPSTLATDDDLTPDLPERNLVVPPIPGKVIRYVTLFMQRYDHNMDGILQEEEWKKMSGTPQAIDIDGDRAIVLDELIRFLAIYGQGRTIHHPQPVEPSFQPKQVSSQFQLFKPFSPIPAQPATADSEKTNLDPATDLTKETMEENETPIDDEVYAEIIANRLAPAVKKYATTPESLRGVPVWFLLRDQDGDGQISLKEFAPTLSVSALGIFGRLDKNGDGFLVPDEVRTAPANKTP